MKKRFEAKKVKFHRVPYGCEIVVAFIDVLMGTELVETDEGFRSLLQELGNYLDERYYMMEGLSYITDETVVFFGEDEESVLDWSSCISELLRKE